MKTCSDLIKHSYPNEPYLLKLNVFEKLENVDVKINDTIRLFTNLAVFDFESIKVHDETLSNSNSVTWVGKHVPISVSIASNLHSSPIFLCKKNPMQLIREFLDELPKLSEQSAAMMQTKFYNVLIQLDEKKT